MSLFRRLLRLKQSKGHGVHSPFAFELITNVLYSPHTYYALHDIDRFLWVNEALFRSRGIEPGGVVKYNQTSFRLVNRFKPERILEFNSGIGVNSLFVLAPNPKAHITFAEDNIKQIDDAKYLLQKYFEEKQNLNFISSDNLISDNTYDAVIINSGAIMPSVNQLLDLSNESTFWIVDSIRSGESKQLWLNIVNHKKVSVTFDMSNTGVAFLHPTFYKSHYYI